MGQWWKSWRRTRNLRKGQRRTPAQARRLPWLGMGLCLLIFSGGALIAWHARQLAQAAAPRASQDLSALQALVPGLSFTVPKAGISIQGPVLVVAGMQAGRQVITELCSTVHIGAGQQEALRLAGAGVHNLVLSSEAMPRLQVSPDASLAWEGKDSVLFSDLGPGTHFDKEAWLLWGTDRALRLQRRPSQSCKAGELLVQSYAPAQHPGARAQVMAVSAGVLATALLEEGFYQLPQSAEPSLEDAGLFDQLRQQGLLRLSPDGLIDIVPRDLESWRKAEGAVRMPALAAWDGLSLTEERRKLLKRLYRHADGAYVREQIRVFNTERSVFAWRAASEKEFAPAPVTALDSARFFAELPAGWGAWHASSRVNLLEPARGGEQVKLMVVGQIRALAGARVLDTSAACTGRACPAAESVQVVRLQLEAGARTLSFEAVPLSLPAQTRDQAYRHIYQTQGKLAWHAVRVAAARSTAASDISLEDRHGQSLWRDGAPTAAAEKAGLAAMLGSRAGQPGSVAEMLGRLPGASHSARLSLDLDLQTVASAALDCIAMRRGRWNGSACSGGGAAPAGRHAGAVLIDTDTGEVLAAAGAGNTTAQNNWAELRAFDQANPARSPWRLPAWQHDGGALQSPGSTFKIISALGLELAAQRDPQLDALLAGLPLDGINRIAQARGFAFQTRAATYPFDSKGVHITNYKDQQLDRRAQDGRFGLAQALTYSLNTWFAWSGELSDRSLLGRPDGGAASLQGLDNQALDSVRPIGAMAHRLGFEQALRLDGGLLPNDFAWSAWDALQSSAAHIDPIKSRHELRQMAIGLRMQATPLHMALAAGAVGQGKIINPRLLLSLDGKASSTVPGAGLGVRLDRVRAGLKGVVEQGTASGAFAAPALAAVRRGLAGKTGTAPTMIKGQDGLTRELATVWFTGWLEPGSLPGQHHRLAIAVFVSHSESTGGEHAAPVAAAILAALKPQTEG